MDQNSIIVPAIVGEDEQQQDRPRGNFTLKLMHTKR